MNVNSDESDYQSFKLKTPVAMMVFNRPFKTARVFEEIRKAKPTKLFIIADGPRNTEEELKCAEVRRIVEHVDWPCEVFKNYSDHNLGCKARVSSGIDWVFQIVEEAMFLEDDCLPDQSFFRFCSEMLERYRHDERIMQVCGYNFCAINPRFRFAHSYYYSNIGIMLGWASWKRAWRYFDVNIRNWPSFRSTGKLQQILRDDAVVNNYEHLLDDYYEQKIDSWDTQWFLARWVHGGFSIVPANNLIQNIGFDSESTHKAVDPNDMRAHVPVQAMQFPLIHPTEIVPNVMFDAYVFKYALSINRHFRQRALWFIQKRIPLLHAVLKKLKSALRNH